MWCSEVRQKAKEAQVVAEQVLGNDRHAEDGTTVLVVNLTTQAADTVSCKMAASRMAH
jgi:hypothetical protein